jgi:CubicO group peptidase (beta-lactamase class C family)
VAALVTGSCALKRVPALLLLVLACVPDGRLKHPGTTVPEQLSDGWEAATPAEAGIAAESLDRAYDAISSEDRYLGALSLLVVRHGKLVFETYVRTPEDRVRLHPIQSATKCITSLALGVAMHHGLPPNVDTAIYGFFPDKFDSAVAKRHITLRHLLTMRSGLDYSSERFVTEVFTGRTRDELATILGRPLYAEPGETFYYRDCDPHLVSCVIQRATGRTTEDLMREQVFTPLGITDLYWEKTREGYTHGPTSLHLRPRDMARVGQLVLQRGNWQGQQLIDTAWIDTCTATQTSLPPEFPPDRVGYGFYWWLLRELGGFSAVGHGGQFICVVPGKELVIVMTSYSYAGDGPGTNIEEFVELVAPIVRSCN